MDYNAYENAIDFKELCTYILRKWRIIFLFFILGAGIAVGWKVVSSPMHSSDVPVNQNESDTNQEKIIIKEKQIESANNIIKRLQDMISLWEKDMKMFQNWLDAPVNTEEKIQAASQIIILNDHILEAQQEIDLSELDLLIYETELTELKNDAPISIPPVTISPINAKQIVIYAIFGAILGVIIICGIIFLTYFFRRRISGANELKSQYGIAVLGSICPPPAGRKKGIDRLLERMIDASPNISIEKQYELIAARIQVLGNSGNEKRNIFITGTIDTEQIRPVFQQLQNFFSQEETDLHLLPNPLYNAESLLRIEKNGVIIVEQKDGSYRKEIEKLAILLLECEAKVLGAIII